MSHIPKYLLFILCLMPSLFAEAYDGKSDLNDYYSIYSQDAASSQDPMTFMQKIMDDLKPNIMRATTKFVKLNGPIATIAYQKGDLLNFKNIVIESFNSEGIRFFGYNAGDIQKASLQLFWTKPSYGQVRMRGEINAIDKETLDKDMKNAPETNNAYQSGMAFYQFKPTQAQFDFMINQDNKKPEHYVVTYTLNEDNAWVMTSSTPKKD